MGKIQPRNLLIEILEENPMLHAKLILLGKRFKHYIVAEDFELVNRSAVDQFRIQN